MAAKGSAALLVEIAQAEVGYIEEAVPENKTKYQKTNQPWCGAFVNWCGKKAGVTIPNTVYTPAGADAFKKAKSWLEGEDCAPQAGDIVYFDFPADGVDRISHVGIVVKNDGKRFLWCIEGNTSGDKKGSQANGDGVYSKKRAYSLVMAVARP